MGTTSVSDGATNADIKLIEIASEIVAAYVSSNSVRSSDLPAVIASVHATIDGLVRGGAVVAAIEGAVETPSPTQVPRSIGRDGLVSFIDGKSYKTLKRHLTANGLTPERYRERYGLPADYPMVCASYSEQRSSLAKSIGLGVPGSRARMDEPSKTHTAA